MRVICYTYPYIQYNLLRGQKLMKLWKLVAGILSCILFVVVMFQSCAAGLANSLSENGEVSGTGGVLLSVLMLAGGIVSIVVRNSTKNGGNIALIVLFGLAALIGFASYGSFSDLAIWAGWCLINAVLALLCIILKKKDKVEPEKIDGSNNTEE